MQKTNFQKLPTQILFSTLLMLIALTPALAETQSTFTVTPANFIILENDLGKKLPITIKNTTAVDIKVKAEECTAIKDDSGVKLSEEKVAKSLIDLDELTLLIKANSESELTTRVKISASGGGSTIPCVLIKPQDVNDTSSVVIPYYIQNFTGEQKFDSTLDIGKTGIVTDTNFTIKGSLTNTGDKFFTPKGKIIISKNGTQISETDITSQINTLLRNGETKQFEVKWTNNLQGFDSIGDYKIELNITTDQSSKTAVKQILFTYIPQDYILLGSIIGGALLLIIIGIVIFKKR